MRKAIIIILFGLSSNIAMASCPSPIAVVTFIDVLEGDSILIQSNGETMLIDSGNSITGHAVYKKLTSLGIVQIDRLIITHPHPDHMGGVFQVTQQIPVNLIHDNGEQLDTSSHDLIRWYSDFVRKNPKYSVLSRGDSFRLGNGSFEILSPTKPFTSKDWNSNSLVIAGNFGDSRILFMGDGNLATEASLIRSATDLKSDILKVGHHGADDATSEAFIKRVNPKISVVSVNKDNIRGYPSDRVIKRLKRYSDTYTTSSSGTVTLTLCTSKEYYISSER